MKYKNSKIVNFAKDCAWGSKRLVDGARMSEEVIRTEIGQLLAHGVKEDNDKLIFEISKYFAKEVNDSIVPDMGNEKVQDFCNLISTLIECCENNNWFKD